MAEARAQRSRRAQERLQHPIQRPDATLRRLPILRLLHLQQLGRQGPLPTRRQELSVARTQLSQRQPASES